MTLRTWKGGGSNAARNPIDWSPSGVPRPGDDLNITQGVINVSGNALAGDTLLVGASIPPSATRTIDINTSTAATLILKASLPPEPSTSVELNVHGMATFTADIVGLAQLTTSGGTIHFIGSSTFTGLHQVFNNNLGGSGTLSLNSADHLSEQMEINGTVGSGLTFNLTSNGPPLTELQIDRPSQFHGAIHLDPPPSPGAFGFVALMGLHATSADLHNGVLQMFDGDKLVETTRLSGGSGLQLEQNSQGVMLSQGLGDFLQPGGAGTIIPLHIS